MRRALRMRTDELNQLWIRPTLKLFGRENKVDFKIDTGCNCVMISRNTLKSLGLYTNSVWFKSLNEVTAFIANGGTTICKALGKAEIVFDGKTLCKVPVICHTTRETHDLLGMSAFADYGVITIDKLSAELRLD